MSFRLTEDGFKRLTESADGRLIDEVVTAPPQPTGRILGGPRHGRAPSFRPTTWAAQPPPVVARIEAADGRTAGGATVTITGYFPSSGIPKVFFGTIPSVTVVRLDEYTITALVPPAATIGPVDVSVTIGGLTSTLVDAFTYYAGAILSVFPDHCLVAGGINVRIKGLNFLTGSTIAFGAAAATNVVFIDRNQFLCTVPVSLVGAGPIDIVITEPGLITVTGSQMFLYTALIPAEDIRRMPSVTIRDALNNAPNSADFVVDGRSAPPVVGAGVEFTDNGVLVFAGQAQSVLQTFDLDKHNLAWAVTAIDHTWALNKRRPFGTYSNQSASDVVIDLVLRYAPGFTTDFVQTGLARISIVFDGTDDFSTCLSRIAQLLGEGHFYIDYRRRVHFFHVKALNRIVASTPTETPTQPLELGPGTGMTVTASTTPIVGPFVPGFYYFKTTTTYGSVPAFNAAPVPAPSGYVQLSTAAATLNLTGRITNGTYSPNGATTFPRGWAGWHADGSYIANGAWTDLPGDVYFASPDIAAELETLALNQFRSAYSPISNIIYLATRVPTFANIPIAPAIAGYAAQKRHIYFTRLGDALADGGTATTGYLEIPDNVTVTITAEPAIFYDVDPVPHVTPPRGPLGAPVLAEAALAIDPTAFLGRAPQPGYYAICVSAVYQDGTESLPSIPSEAVFISGTKQVIVNLLPIGRPVNGVAAMFRKLYCSIVLPFDPVTNGVPDFQPGHTNLTWIVPDNTSLSVTFHLGALSGGDGDAMYPVGVPLGTASSTIAHADGPDLEAAEAPTPITDSNPYLLLDPPIQITTDLSQLRNRVFVKGRGTIVTNDAVVGSLEVLVAEVSSFSPTGGRVILGSRVLSYRALSALTGAGAILLARPLAQPILQGDWKFGGGTPIRPFVQVDDAQSQQQLGLIELDALGKPTDGVHEYTVDDDTLSTTEQLFARGLAELQLFSRPIVRLTYATRDPRTRSGKIVAVDVTTPPIKGHFILQEVTIDQYHDQNDQLAPRYSVVADSAARFNFNDLLLYLDDRRAAGSTAFSGLVDTALTQASASLKGFPFPEFFWWASSVQRTVTGDTTTPLNHAGVSTTGAQVAGAGGWIRSPIGYGQRRQTTTAVGSGAGYSCAQTDLFQWSSDPDWTIVLQTGDDITECRMWAVCARVTQADQDGIGNGGASDGAGFRYSSAIDAGKWTAVAETINGQLTISDETWGIQPDTIYKLRIRKVGDLLHFSINNGIEKIINTVSLANFSSRTEIQWQYLIFNRTTAVPAVNKKLGFFREFGQLTIGI